MDQNKKQEIFYITLGVVSENEQFFQQAVRIFAKDEEKARETMFSSKYGREWCTSYSHDSFHEAFSNTSSKIKLLDVFGNQEELKVSFINPPDHKNFFYQDIFCGDIDSLKNAFRYLIADSAPVNVINNWDESNDLSYILSVLSSNSPVVFSSEATEVTHSEESPSLLEDKHAKEALLGDISFSIGDISKTEIEIIGGIHSELGKIDFSNPKYSRGAFSVFSYEDELYHLELSNNTTNIDSILLKMQCITDDSNKSPIEILESWYLENAKDLYSSHKEIIFGGSRIQYEIEEKLLTYKHFLSIEIDSMLEEGIENLSEEETKTLIKKGEKLTSLSFPLDAGNYSEDKSLDLGFMSAPTHLSTLTPVMVESIKHCSSKAKIQSIPLLESKSGNTQKNQPHIKP